MNTEGEVHGAPAFQPKETWGSLFHSFAKQKGKAEPAPPLIDADNESGHSEIRDLRLLGASSVESYYLWAATTAVGDVQLGHARPRYFRLKGHSNCAACA